MSAPSIYATRISYYYKLLAQYEKTGFPEDRLFILQSGLSDSVLVKENRWKSDFWSKSAAE